MGDGLTEWDGSEGERSVMTFSEAFLPVPSSTFPKAPILFIELTLEQ